MRTTPALNAYNPDDWCGTHPRPWPLPWPPVRLGIPFSQPQYL